jgi:hypothetical protein
LQLLYSIRSERLLMEQLEYKLLFRWFVGLNVDEPVWVATVFSKNRDRLLEGEIAAKLFAQVLDQARASDLLSDEHFSVDGTLIEARPNGRDSCDSEPGLRHFPPAMTSERCNYTATIRSFRSDNFDTTFRASR